RARPPAPYTTLFRSGSASPPNVAEACPRSARCPSGLRILLDEYDGCLPRDAGASGLAAAPSTAHRIKTTSAIKRVDRTQPVLDRLGALPQGRRGQIAPGRGRRQPDRVGDGGDDAVAVPRLGNGVESQRCRQVHSLCDRVDRRTGQTRLGEDVEPFLVRLLTQRLDEFGLELVPVDVAVGEVREAGVGGPFRVPEDLGEPGELAVVAAGDDDLAL